MSAFGEFAARPDEEQGKAVGGFYRPTRRCHPVPGVSTFHSILSALPPDPLDEALAAWSARPAGLAPVAMDGKPVRGASKTSDTKPLWMAAVRALSRRLDRAGRVVTPDAIHARQETARCRVEDGGAHCGVTAVKDPPQTIREDRMKIDWTRGRRGEAMVDQGPGRTETRRRGGPHREEVERPLRPVRPQTGHPHRARTGHRQDRAFTCDGDRCRAAAGNLPRNRAALRHAAISIVRMEGRFPYLPPANRHYAARPREAVDAVLRPG